MRHDGIDQLADAAIALVGERRRALLGIAGAPGAGKSTLAEALLVRVAATQGTDWVAHVPMDGFHLADVQLERLGARGRKGAPDTFDADGYADLLRRLLDHPDQPIYAPGFERTLEQPIAAAVVVPPSARLVVTEGNYLLLPQPRWEAARAQLTEAWYVTTHDDARQARLVDRHVAFGKDAESAARWVRETDEANAALISSASHRADRLIVNTPDGWVC
ncbi:MAG TPA: nucleoside/nucleotide kinase family protein [Intrasporangium sp.]|uniref:nucleoside/nucleotide kinase family protein n=1 Tax=Intrasporangium sp. TaxID=1925024 RepID=UPI002B46510D|nr:nucleoside/nucleotide kinase family protein [Intrasporangium sp.]HKX68581.1 nucleoside/nucleotide kinase family protein [Intrasporangium sp.]